MSGEQQLEPGWGRVITWLARQSVRPLASLGLTQQEYVLLAMLEDNPSFASGIAARLSLGRSRASLVIDGLVDRGLVARQTDPVDRRRIQHALTDLGAELLQRADASVDESYLARLKDFQPTTQAPALEAASKLGEVVRAFRVDAVRRAGEAAPQAEQPQPRKSEGRRTVGT